MSGISAELHKQTATLLQSLRTRHLTLTTAESCTGGLLSALITEIPGSSDVFTHGYVTYSNAAKTAMLGVPEPLIKVHGAVSEKVAVALAENAQHTAGADIAVSITGIAGPGGATKDKPVGLVYIACARKGLKTLQVKYNFSGDRARVRLQAITAALELIQQQLNH